MFETKVNGGLFMFDDSPAKFLGAASDSGGGYDKMFLAITFACCIII